MLAGDAGLALERNLLLPLFHRDGIGLAVAGRRQQHAVGNLGGVVERPRLGIGAAGIQAKAHRPQVARHQVLLHVARHAHGHIHLGAHGIAHPVGEQHADAHLRVPFLEGQQHVGQVQLAQARGNAQPHRARHHMLQRVDGALRGLHLLDDAAPVLVQHLARRRQQKAARRAVQQGHAQRRLQRLELLAHLGARDVALARRSAEAARVHDLYEIADEVDVHGLRAAGQAGRLVCGLMRGLVRGRRQRARTATPGLWHRHDAWPRHPWAPGHRAFPGARRISPG